MTGLEIVNKVREMDLRIARFIGEVFGQNDFIVLDFDIVVEEKRDSDGFQFFEIFVENKSSKSNKSIARAYSSPKETYKEFVRHRTESIEVINWSSEDIKFMVDSCFGIDARRAMCPGKNVNVCRKFEYLDVMQCSPAGCRKSNIKLCQKKDCIKQGYCSFVLEKMNGKEDFLYFMSNKSSGLIKIGRSIDPDKRRHQIASASGSEIVLEKKFLKFGDYEKQVHSLMAEHRVRGEWFMRNPMIEKILSPDFGPDLLHALIFSQKS